jgi:dienelactone hydrolase
MSELIVFHHAQGLTDGVKAFADDLRAAGHTVHTPDLHEGRTFATLPEAMGYVQETGFDTIIERGRAAAESLPSEVVYVGFSLGVLPAQYLAQTKPGAQGGVFIYSFVPPSEFGSEWPAGVPLQIHMMESDPEVLPPNGDLEAAQAMEGAELFLYPGDRHLFADSSLPDYDETAAQQLMQRVLALLG